jgi:hypothetical protein
MDKEQGIKKEAPKARTQVEFKLRIPEIPSNP